MTGRITASLNVALPPWLAERAAACAPITDGDARMAFVIDLARRNVEANCGGPFAAAVFEIASGRLLAAATNQVVASACSAAHAELLALSLAQQSVGRYDLGAPGDPACELVGSAEPCLMCCGAVLWSGIRRLVYAATDADVRAIGFDEGPKHPHWIEELRRRGIEVAGEVLRPQAQAVLAAYRERGGVVYNSRGGGLDMETHLADFIRDTREGREAKEILRQCVHCGFCTATCPTYQLLGDELDSPRGRIYLIKQVLEGKTASARTQLHLDRCLTCRACETICPSGVQYGRLLDIGRAIVADQVPRPPLDRLARASLRATLPRASLLVPARRSQGHHDRRMLALAGCVQPALLPNINAATARVLDRLGIELRESAAAGCCGALRHHLDDADGARAAARRNIDAWWPEIEGGAEAIVVTASGCGTEVKDYGHLLQDDRHYAAKAVRVSALARDIAEVVANERQALSALLAERPAAGVHVAFHAPCSLQHGQRLRNVVEPLLTVAGFVLTSVADAHLCCGSAGTYSLLQPKLAKRLRRDKLSKLMAGEPSIIASANVGCITHLRGGCRLPVRHWIELLDESLGAAGGKA